MFDLQEAAIGYAKSAERILGEDARFLNENPEVVPIFISLLFQPLEISLKHLGLNRNYFRSKSPEIGSSQKMVMAFLKSLI